MKKLGLIVGSLLILLLVAYAALPRAEKAQPDTVHSLSQELGLAFPPSTRLLGVRRENGMDDLIAVRLEMPESDFAPFLRTTPILAVELTPKNNYRLGSTVDEWEPSKALGLKTGFAWLEKEHRALYIGVAPAQDGWVVLFVVNHGT